MIVLTNDRISSITCDIADEILQILIPNQHKRIIHEYDTNSTYYTDEAQETFDELYDMIEHIIEKS